MLSREEFKDLKEGKWFGWNTIQGKFEFLLAMSANTYEDYVKSMTPRDGEKPDFGWQLYIRCGHHSSPSSSSSSFAPG